MTQKEYVESSVVLESVESKCYSTRGLIHRSCRLDTKVLRAPFCSAKKHVFSFAEWWRTPAEVLESVKGDGNVRLEVPLCASRSFNSTGETSS